MMIGSDSVTSPSLLGKRTKSHPPVLTKVEIKPFPKKRTTGKRRRQEKGLGFEQNTCPLCYFSGENIMQGPITLYHFRYLQQPTSFLLRSWKSEDKNLTPESMLNLSPNSQKLRKFAIPTNHISFLMFF